MKAATIHAPDFDALSSGARDVLGQLFIVGPTWDGNVISKAARDELVTAGYVERFNGWQQLSVKGLALAIDEGTLQRVRHWADQRWYRKARA